MRLHVTPGVPLEGAVKVPGDKSIAHRWLILSSTARGRSRLEGLPGSLDVRSTASCLAALVPKARPALDLWVSKVALAVEDRGSTWNGASREGSGLILEVEGEGRSGLSAPGEEIDCGNSGTSIRLLAGVVAGSPVSATFTGDESLRRRPMERVAVPLRAMGAEVETTAGHAPISVRGGDLVGIDHTSVVPSAQVKGSLLLAGLSATGVTTVRESAPTRDHTERAIEALGGVCRRGPGWVAIEPFTHEGFDATVPGDVSSAAFLLAAAALTGGEVHVEDVGLNPTRLAFVEVLSRMGVQVEMTETGSELGEPVGSIRVSGGGRLAAIRVEPDELPLIIDEVPILAMMAAFAGGDSWFLGAAELRAKESDRLTAVAVGVRSMGGHAADEGEDLVLAGGGLSGGFASAGGDHRLAMALTVAALAAERPSTIEGIEAADVSFPGFVETLRALGAHVVVEP